MKHLKSYKLFESINEEVQDIKDILIELTDAGYKIYIKDFTIKNSKQGLSLIITSEESAGRNMIRTSNRLLPIDIGDYLLRVNSYLKELNWVGFNSFQFDNHQVNVEATLKGVENVFIKEINEFDDYLNNSSFLAAPFNTVKLHYYKIDNINESVDFKPLITKQYAEDFQDIFQEIQDYSNLDIEKSYYDNDLEEWLNIKNFNNLDKDQYSISFYVNEPQNRNSTRSSIDKDIVSETIDCFKRVIDFSPNYIKFTITFREITQENYITHDKEISIDNIDKLLDKKIVSLCFISYCQH